MQKIAVPPLPPIVDSKVGDCVYPLAPPPPPPPPHQSSLRGRLESIRTKKCSLPLVKCLRFSGLFKKTIRGNF